MIDFEYYLNKQPYDMTASQKKKELTNILVALSRHHQENCPEYASLLDSFSCNLDQISSYEELPFVPVRIFKEYELRSCPNEAVTKTMTSSGTTGQQVSKIYLDKQTSRNQQKVMTSIVTDFIGKKRLPMIIIDTPSVIKDRSMFSARGAGILGFSVFGRDRIFALDEKMELDVEGVRSFIYDHEDEEILLFGFTFMIWQHFYKRLFKLGETLNLSKGYLIHGGGWKKLEQEAISSTDFKSALKQVCNIEHVYDYYGMVEQTGSIYMQCDYGHLHASSFSDLIIRDPQDWSVAPYGERGIIEVVSMLPLSYPGHILLTEDEGVILGEDDCPCGRKGKYFKIFGRIKNAEIRGCSDTYADTFIRRNAK